VRANDLIWSSVVTHYLLGDEARASDLLWWFDDGARIPARFLKEYGADVLGANRLKDPGGLTLAGQALDLSQVTTPIMLVALKDRAMRPICSSPLWHAVSCAPLQPPPGPNTKNTSSATRRWHGAFR